MTDTDPCEFIPIESWSNPVNQQHKFFWLSPGNPILCSIITGNSGELFMKAPEQKFPGFAIYSLYLKTQSIFYNKKL